MLRLWLGVIALAALTATASLFASGARAQTPGAPVVPIPTDPGNSSVAPFEGSPASPNPVEATDPPQHPFMAPNGRNNIHNDPYMSGAYRVTGPMTDGAEVSALFNRECASVMFDSQGRIVTICVGLDRPVLALLDPHSLAVLAAMQLPVRNLASGNNPFNDFSGGGYFYLDHRDRAVLSTNDRHVLEVAIASGPSFVTTRDVDLSQELASNDGIISVLPDWRGRFWFVTRRGVVGTIDRGSGEVKLRPLSGEGISNSFSVDETGGVFIVSDRALYRFDAGPNGGPTITWRIVYPNSGIHKPSQSDAGSGTTPDLMGNELVAITDNADPMNVQVYRRAADLNPPPGKKKRKKKRKRRAAIILSAATNTAAGSTATTSAASTAARSKKKRKKKRKRQAAAAARQVCSVPVFRPGASATDNSLITTNKAIVVENNYGYTGIGSTMNGAVTEPGLIRIDVVKKDAKAKKRKKRKKKRKRHTTNILSAATKTAAGSTATNAAATAARSKKKRKKRRKGETAYTCRTAWTSNERAPSVVPKLSLANGLVYAYTKPPRADDVDAWFLTALDFHSGRTVFSRRAGSGFGYNNNYAPVTLGPDGTAYVGVLGGLVAFP